LEFLSTEPVRWGFKPTNVTGRPSLEMGSQKMAHTGVSLRNDGVDEASHVFQHEILALNQ